MVFEKNFLLKCKKKNYFLIISLFKLCMALHLKNLNPHDPGMPCAKFGWNWPIGSGEEDENLKSFRQRQLRRQIRRQTRDKFDQKSSIYSLA